MCPTISAKLQGEGPAAQADGREIRDINGVPTDGTKKNKATEETPSISEELL